MKNLLLLFPLILCQVLHGAASLSGASATASPAAGGKSFSLTVSPDAAWTASTTASWLSVSPTSGSTSAVITYTWTANTASVARQARVDIAGKSFFVLQPGTGGVYTPWGSSGPGTIVTVAGSSSGLTGDGGPATAAQLTYPVGMAVDGNGNLYIADTTGRRVRRVDAATGVISTVAGTGSAGFSGDGGAAVSATVSPVSVALNQAGDIYILDSGNYRVRRIDHSSGLISTIAGNGSSAESGDGGPATAAGISNAAGLSIDGKGNLYFCEKNTGRVRKIDITSGTITTVAGNGSSGFSGDGSLATSASLYYPSATAVDAGGNLYIADTNNYRVRRVDAVTGLISTVSGTGPLALGQVSSFVPQALAFDPAGNLFVGDSYHRIFRIDGTTNLVTAVANGNYGGGQGLAADAGGSLYISDSNGGRIRFMDLATPVVTPSSTAVNLSAAAGSGTAAFTLTPSGAYWSALSSAGWLTLTEAEGNGNGSIAYSYTANNSPGSRTAAIAVEGKVIQVTQAGAVVTLSASNAIAPAAGGNGSFLMTVSPSASWTATSSAGWLTVTPASGSASASLTWTAAANTGANARSATITAGGKTFTVTQLSGSGVYTPWGGTANSQITTIAGGGAGADNIAATQTSLSTPGGIALDANNNLFIADSGANKIRRVDAVTGIVTTIAGTGSKGFDGDGGAATSALLNAPQGIAVVGQTVYFADAGNNRIRKIDAGGTITTIAGTDTPPYGGEGGPGTSVILNSPYGLGADASGNIYFTETVAPRVRRMDAISGAIVTVAGNGVAGYSGDGGPAIAASLNGPTAIAVDKTGNIFIADTSNYRIRRVDAATGVITTAAGTGSSCCGGGDNGPATSATLSLPVGVTFDAAGNLVISDAQRIRRVDRSGTIATIAGSGNYYSGDSQSALLAYISPSGIVGDQSGNLYVIDGARIRFIDFSTPSIALSAQNLTVGQAGGSGSISMTLLPAGAFWGAVSSAPWLTVTTPTGSGSGSVGYSASANNSVIPRIASITVAGKNVIVTQPGAKASLASHSATVDATAGSATVNLAVTADVQWSASSSVSWLTVTSTSGTGSTSITYSWTANGGATPRLATITIAGQPFSVLQGTTTQLFSVWGGATRGTIQTIAGNGQSPPYNSVTDGVAATSTPIAGQRGVAVDGNGNLFVVDGGRVRRVDAATGIISTVAGGGVSGHLGDGGLATSAYLSSPYGLALDPQGNLFISDTSDQRIRRVDATTGIITTVAGNGGSGGYGGDGGRATVAQLNYPYDIAVDSNGVLYIADSGNYRIRRVDPVSGLITTIAGTGISGLSGNGGPGVQAQIGLPRWIAVDASSDVFAVDTQNSCVWKISGETGVISIVAGHGSTGPQSGGQATGAYFYQLFGLAADAQGNLYVGNANQLYRVDATTNVLTTVAGQGSSGDGGPALLASLNNPWKVTLDGAGNIYLSESWRVRYINQSTPQVTVAPAAFVPASANTGQVTFSVSPANVSWAASSSVPWLTIGSPNGSGATAISYSVTANDSFGSRTGLITVLGRSFAVQQSGVSATVSPTGVTVNAAAGSGNFGLTAQTGAAWTASSSDAWLTPSPASGSGSALMSYSYTANTGTTPRAAAITVAGKTFSITQLPASLQYSPWGTGGNGIISTIAGGGSSGYSGDGGPAMSATLNGPYGVAVSAGNILYVADTGNHRIRAIDPATGAINTIAGVGTAGFSGDGGQAASTKFSSPSGVALDAAGNLFVADTGNNRIRRIDATTGLVSTVAGTGASGYGGDGGPATAATLSRPLVMVLDSAGNIYISDTGNSVIRRVDNSSGRITTIAGTGLQGYSGDSGPATQAQLNQPSGLAIDSAGNLLIADAQNSRVRRVDAATGIITTIAGSSGSGFAGDGGLATSANLSTVAGVAVDSANNLYIADAGNYRIRRVDGATGLISTIAGTGCCNSSAGDGGPAMLASLYSMKALAVNSSGLYVADSSRIRFIDLGSPVVTPTVSSINLGNPAGTGSTNVTVSPSGAVWAAASTVPWITLTHSGGAGSGSIGYTYTANNSTSPRSGAITIYDKRILVSQAGATTTLSSGSAVLPSTGGTFDVGMTLSSPVAWTASSSASWITPNSSSGNGDATITWTYSANSLANARMATLQIGGKAFSVVQIGAAGHYTPWGALGNGIITTIAGGAGSQAPLSSPYSVALDKNGNLYVSEFERIIRVDAATGAETTIAGTGSFGESGDGGPATSATLASPAYMAFDAAGNLYFSDSYTDVVRKVDAITGIISRVAGTPNSSYSSSGDGGLATYAIFSSLGGIAVDNSRNILYVGDGGRVRAVDLFSGIISTYVGTGTYGFSGDGGPASQAQISGVSTIALDASGNLYIGDSGNDRIRRVDAATRKISTVAGAGSEGFSGDGGLATNASIYSGTFSMDAAGNTYLSDYYNNRIRKVDAVSGIITTIAGTGGVTSSGDGGPATLASVSRPGKSAVDGSGNLYFIEGGVKIRFIDYASPSVTLTSSSASVAAAAGSGSFSFTISAGGSWSASSDSSWLTISPSSGSGNGTISYVYSANAGTASRTGVITVGGKTLSVVQAGTSVGGGGGNGGGGSGPPAGNPLTAIPNTITLTAAAGGATVTQNFTVTYQSFSTTAPTFAANFNTNQGQGWLSVSPASGTMALSQVTGLLFTYSATITVSGNPASLTAGNVYTGTVNLSAAAGIVSVPVTLNISSQPTKYTVAPQSLNFRYQQGDATTPAAQNLSVFSAPSGSAFTASASSTGNWLAVSVGGKTPSVVSVGAIVNGLAPGTYSGTISITSGNSVTHVAVSLTVVKATPPALSISPLTENISLAQDASATGGQATISNSGGGTLQFTASSDATWLTLAATSGSAVSGSPVSLRFLADPSGLNPGTYDGHITVNDSTVTVVLTVTKAAAPSIQLSKAGVSLAGVVGGSAPPAQTVAVSNSGAGTLNWTAHTSTTSGGSWLSAVKSGSSITISANTSGLLPGQYYGSVNVVEADAVNSPQTISVSLNVMAATAVPGVLVSTGGVLLVGTAGSAAASQSVTLFNASPTAVTYSASVAPAGGWLSMSAASGTLNAGANTIQISADMSALAAGVQQGTITLGFSDGTSAAINVAALALPAGITPSVRGGLRPMASISACAAGKASYLIPIFRSPANQSSVQTTGAVTVQAQVVDDCGRAVTAAGGGSVQVTFSNGDPGINLNDVGGGVWEVTWVPANVGTSVALHVAASANGLAANPSLSALSTVTVSVTAASANAAPAPTGIANAASAGQATPGVVSPGSYIAIYGTGLAGSGNPSATSLPLPTNLNGTQLFLGGLPMPLLYAGPGQVNAIVPQGIAPNASYPLVVVRGTAESVPVSLTVTQLQPGAYTVDTSGSGRGIVTNAVTGALISSSNPAHAGDYLVIYCTGLGALVGANGETQPADGAAAPGDVIYHSAANVKVTIGGVSIPASFAGLTPTFAGLYQVNIQVPDGVASGSAVPVAVTASDPATGVTATGNAVTIALQ